MQTHSSILARESPWTEEPGMLQLFWAGYFLSPGAHHAILTPGPHLVWRLLLLPGLQGHGTGAEACPASWTLGQLPWLSQPGRAGTHGPGLCHPEPTWCSSPSWWAGKPTPSFSNAITLASHFSGGPHSLWSSLPAWLPILRYSFWSILGHWYRRKRQRCKFSWLHWLILC